MVGCPGRGASQVEKSSRLNWATQFLTVAYDGAYFPYFLFVQKLGQNICVVLKGVQQTLADRENYYALRHA